MKSTIDISRKRQIECEKHCLWLQKKLKLLSKLNWITVLVPSLLGVVAGSAFFVAEKYSELIAFVAIVAALLSATHKGLNCDSYQSDCRRLLMEYRALSKAYRSISEIQPKDAEASLLKLEAKLEEISGSDSISSLKLNNK